MAFPRNREEFKEYCLRRLGKPVIQINVSDQQVEQIIDDALQYFQYNHFNGSITIYHPVEVSQEVLSKRYFVLHPSIIGVKRVLETSFLGSDEFSTYYFSMTFGNPFSLNGNGLLPYYLAQSFYETLNALVNTSTNRPLRYTKTMNKLFLDIDWKSVKKGQIFIVEVIRALDPKENPEIWNDYFMKEYTTALIQKQWGNNLRKLRNVQLVGGVTIDADGILQEAEQKIKELEDRLKIEFQEPVDFMVG